MTSTTFYSSDRRRADGLVTFTPRTLALSQQDVSAVRQDWEETQVPLEDECPVAAADVVRNLGREAFVVHQQKVNFPHIADKELLEPVREEVAGLQKLSSEIDDNNLLRVQ